MERPGHSSDSVFTFVCSDHAGRRRWGHLRLCCFLLRERISVHFIENPLFLLCNALQRFSQKKARFVLTLSLDHASLDSKRPRRP